ncbi:MAG: hypothetical protein COV59_03465 [Candidatus Magasanikbacteria bacterium CG11_big_fil_rev_8_21_14_0_20_39_34]|uniref:Polymerase nucleotidyl transferase domain-containing protein n=1 Tax=Candidatus Magasanikbacteria bacterium CG11_big_fil_rev_8_21_14_0_20_39_34 TaxID=1974653 RepID=A0A2H0N7X0_9BACT|nr:MAG: hypothetical protein COV59_03465 [Candidatus Magasanikbacteria bacterium CG11_big_fil_rev_8_21_14_0_20_39_34]
MKESREIQKKLQTLLTPHNVLLGGSLIRGESTPHSDVDFFVVPKNLWSLFFIIRKKQSIQKLAELHVCFPKWIQKHFYYVYGKNVDGMLTKITPLPHVAAYNCAMMCTILLMEASIALVDNHLTEANHISQKLKKNVLLLKYFLQMKEDKKLEKGGPLFNFEQDDIFSLSTLSNLTTKEIDVLFSEINSKKIKEVSTYVTRILETYFLHKKSPLLLESFSTLDLLRKGDFHTPKRYFNKKWVEKINTAIQNEQHNEIKTYLSLAQKKLIHWITI